MKTNKTTHTNDHDLVGADAMTAAARAFERFAAERAAYTPEQLTKRQVNVPKAVGIVRSAAERIAAVAPEEGDETIPGFHKARLAELPDIALATWHAWLACNPADERRSALVAEAQGAKTKLLGLVDRLPDFDVLTDADVANIPRASGDLGLAETLGALGAVCRANAQVLTTRTPITEEMIADVERLGAELLDLVGERNDVGKKKHRSPAEDDLLRAVTMMLDRYAEAQRALRFLRWKEKDAYRIAPALSTRTRRRRKAEVASPAPAVAPTPAPATSPVTPK